jgi:FxsC-like protein
MAQRPDGPTAQWPLYFFLSYAHGRAPGPQDRFEHDSLVHRFKQDLDSAVTELATHPRSIIAGLSDRHIPVGGRWPDHLADALARCRSFVAMYCTAYFDSPECGREWTAFTARMNRDFIRDKVSHEAIIPVMWLPIRAEALPQSVKYVQFTHASLGSDYNLRGLRYLMTHRELREQYLRAVEFFAQRVIEVAENDAPSVLSPAPAYESFADAFADAQRAASDRPRLRIAVAAPQLGRLPRHADPGLYGPSPREWKPYLPAYTGEITETVKRLAESLGFRVFVENAEHCRELLVHTEPTMPTVLLVDPWVVLNPDARQRLSAFDQGDPPKSWIRLVIPWNRARPAADAPVDLDGHLDAALGRARERCRRETPRAVDGLESIEDLIEDLPEVFRIAERHFLAEARTYPPQPRQGAPAPERLRLRGPRLPGPRLPGVLGRTTMPRAGSTAPGTEGSGPAPDSGEE